MKATACAAAAAIMAALCAAGCSSAPPKTAAGFCKVYEQQKSQYLAKYGQPSSGGGLAALGQLVGAVSDWVPMFEAMDAAAPPDIEPDVHNVVDSLKQQEQAVAQEATDPLGGLASGLMSGLMATSSWNNLSQYITRNCGPEGG